MMNTSICQSSNFEVTLSLLIPIFLMSFLYRFLVMGIVAKFLENSSICGWAHISTSKNIIERVYWIVVSALMVAGAGYLTADAVNEWDLDPISTVTKVKTIYDVKFPMIVVCPPKVSFSFPLFNLQLE